MLFSLKSLTWALGLLPLISQVTATGTEPTIMIKPTDANFGISAAAPGRFVTSADGTKIFADSSGDPHKPAIVFIHGFGIGGAAFDTMWNDPLWSAKAYMVRYDTRGHGRSDKPTDPAAWESQRLSEDFDAVVQSYQLVKPYVFTWSFGATHITDVLTFHPPSYLSGIIYDAPLPYIAAIPNISSPATAAYVPGLLQTTNVTQFQASNIAYINSCHPALDWDFYVANLGHGAVQPRAVSNLIFSRTQNATGLLNAGTSGQLPLLAIFGDDDQVVMKQGVLDAIPGWKRLTVVDVPNAQHYTWISSPVTVRGAVLNFIGNNSD